MIDFRGRINAVTMVYVPHLTSINPPDMNFHFKKMLQPDILRTNWLQLLTFKFLWPTSKLRHQLCSDIDIEATDFNPMIFILDY